MASPVTLAQIAREVGTTVATVSMALRGKPGISAKTAQRVREAAQRLGYEPDPRFSQLMHYLRTRRDAPFQAVLAYLHDFPVRDGFRSFYTHAQFFEGASGRALSLGYKVEPFWVREPGLDEERLCGILRARGIPGVLLVTSRRDGWPLRGRFEGFGAAVIGYTEWEPPFCRACNNQHHGMLEILSRLEQAGYRRIGLVLSTQDDANCEHNWLSAYLAHHYRLPRARRPAPLLGPAHQIYTEKALENWLEKQRVDCVVGHTDPLLDRILETGRKVPEDIGFATLDWFPRGDGLECSGMDQNSAAVGAAAVELVISQLAFQESGCRENPRLTLIDGLWRWGVTTRHPTAA